MTLIDIHSHFHPPRMIAELSARQVIPRAYTEDGTTFIHYGEGVRFPVRPAMTDLTVKLAGMDAAGIEAAILSVTQPGVDGLGSDAPRVAQAVNDELGEICFPERSRLGWVCVLPMDEPTAAAVELRRAVVNGARGAMIFSNAAGRALDIDTDGPVFAAACDLDVPLILHPSYPLSATTLDGYELVSTLGYLFDTATTALRLVLSGLYTRYPDLKFVLCHAGSLLIHQSGRIDYQAMNRPGGIGPIDGRPSDHIRRMYTDSVCFNEASLAFAIDFFGASRTMFGTDDPQWPMDRGVDTLASTQLTADQRTLVESGTAAALFRWGTP